MVLRNRRWAIFLWLVLLTACSASEPTIPAPTIPAGQNPRIPNATPITITRWARRDAIPPIYEPNFAPAGDITLKPEELIMGVAFGGEAKAYPITTMQFREMVNDELAGIPILVTW